MRSDNQQGSYLDTKEFLFYRFYMLVYLVCPNKSVTHTGAGPIKVRLNARVKYTT